MRPYASCRRHMACRRLRPHESSMLLPVHHNARSPCASSPPTWVVAQAAQAAQAGSHAVAVWPGHRSRTPRPSIHDWICRVAATEAVAAVTTAAGGCCRAPVYGATVAAVAAAATAATHTAAAAVPQLDPASKVLPRIAAADCPQAVRRGTAERADHFGAPGERRHRRNLRSQQPSGTRG